MYPDRGREILWEIRVSSAPGATSPGRLYGVGVGPGDPELLTLKAQRVLGEVPIVCVPQSETSQDSFAYTIARQFIDTGRQRVMRISFPTDDAEGAAQVWRSAAEQLAQELLQGQDVAFITEGDPMLYSTFAYVLEGIQSSHPSIPVEIVPGVSSVMAAAAISSLQAKIAVGGVARPSKSSAASNPERKEKSPAATSASSTAMP